MKFGSISGNAYASYSMAMRSPLPQTSGDIVDMLTCKWLLSYADFVFTELHQTAIINYRSNNYCLGPKIMADYPINVAPIA